MDSFVTRKRKRTPDGVQAEIEEESTDFKIALLSSLHPAVPQDVLFESLLAHEGSVEKASYALEHGKLLKSPRKSGAIGYQSALPFTSQTGRVSKLLTKKGQTLHLYSPQDVEKHTPCSLIHNFLPAADADRLLRELLLEVPHFRTETFQLFDRTVQSPHKFAFFVDSLEEVKQQKEAYVYNGSVLADVRQSTPEMLRSAVSVQKTVNAEIKRRIEQYNEDKQKLKFQSADEWRPNTSFINRYDGGKESVGYHSDQLTYLGPRAVIACLSVGVEREFRVRRIVPSDEPDAADTQGQIAIHLTHNSLLIMHAEMQEEWKHAIAPARTIDPHPVAGNLRISITYRYYPEALHPRHTLRCQCNVPCVLRCVQRQAATRGRYVWMCHSNSSPGVKGCSFFKWAEFDEDGRPPWAKGYKGNANVPMALDEPEKSGERGALPDLVTAS